MNDELAALESFIDSSMTLVRSGGRLVILTFHSLEDRIVKRFLTDRSGRASRGSRHAPAKAPSREPTFRVSGKQPRMPEAREVRATPRSRSARLRSAERTAAPCWNLS